MASRMPSPVELADRVPADLTGTRRRRLAGLGVVLAALVLAVLASLLVGARDLPPRVVAEALLQGRHDGVHALVWDLRLPRTVVALAVGPALGVCGALIQGLTRNPLADPGILGVNTGAGFAVTLGIGLLGLATAWEYVWLAFAGALLATVVVYLIASIGTGTTPEKLILAGVAIAAVLDGIAASIAFRRPEDFEGLRFWGVGSLGGRGLDVVATVAPFLGIGIALALLTAPSLNALALGDDLGRALGVHVLRMRVVCVVAVTLLAGGATALAGPVAFVGFMVPHIARWFAGPDQRWILPLSAVLAAVVLLLADVLARIVLPQGELRVGLVTAVLGAPLLIALVRRRQASEL